MAKRQDVIVLLDMMADLRPQVNPDGTVKGDMTEYIDLGIDRVLGWPNPDTNAWPSANVTWGDEGAKGGG